MLNNTSRRWFVVVFALVTVTGAALAAERTWTDATGKFSVTAELVVVRGNNVVLRRTDGKQITVPLEQLSDKDRAFVAAGQAEDPAIDSEDPATDTQAATQDIVSAAKRFYSDLRGSDRGIARQLLTAKAQPLMAGEKSPLAQLPSPATGTNSIRTGKVEISGGVAEIPVRIRAGGKTHQTKLHFRREADDWRIFAISAEYPDGEKSINFEVEVAATQETGDPLQAMLGKPLELAGFALDGSPLDMANYQGKVVLVDFWATWCGPCRAEMPNIRQNWTTYHDQGFEVIAISVDRDLEALGAFVAQEQPPWTVVADHHPNNATSMGSKYGIRGIPAFVLLGRDGRVAAVNCRGQRLGQEIARLIGGRG